MVIVKPFTSLTEPRTKMESETVVLGDPAAESAVDAEGGE